MKDLYEIVYRKAFESYGKQMQMIVAIEELSELQKELCKTLRGKMNLENIVEELADVEIMTEQMRLMFDVGQDVELMKEQKIKRLEHSMLENRDEK